MNFKEEYEVYQYRPRLAKARQDAADGRTHDALDMGDELRKEYGI